MNNYKNFNQITLEKIDNKVIEDKYNEGYVFTRIDKGVMDKIRSLRIDLSSLKFNSENRRIMRKVEGLELEVEDIPIDKDTYDYRIHKIGKEFYKEKNDEAVFSASKIKELVTDPEKSNFTQLYNYYYDKEKVGYCIVYNNQNISHYAFPFYDIEKDINNLGMGMILKAIQRSLNINQRYFYLGSVHSEKSLYKLQFNNMQWWNSVDNEWLSDLEKLKNIVRSS